MSPKLKKIAIATLYIFLFALLGGYFYAGHILREDGRKSEVCRQIKVTLLDSALNKFVTKNEVINIIERFNGKTIGSHIDSINLVNLETLLNRRSVVKESQVYITRDGVMNVNIKQRKPVIRIETKSGGYYIDETAYIFPLIENYSSYVPIVTGEVPIDVQYQEVVGKDSLVWIDKILNLGKFLESNPFWNAQIEQIYFSSPENVELYTRVGKQKIILGDLKDIENKFAKLYAFYNSVIPQYGWDRYNLVDLRFKNQIVCKKN